VSASPPFPPKKVPALAGALFSGRSLFNQHAVKEQGAATHTNV
jgi:hypothetical protein